MSKQSKKLSSFLDVYEEREEFLRIIERYLDAPPITRVFNDNSTKGSAEMGWNLLVELSTGVPMQELEGILCGNEKDSSPVQEKMREVIRSHPAFLSNRP